MSRRFSLVPLIVLFFTSFSQSGFEGIFAVEYKNEKGESTKMNVKVKDKMVYLKNTEGDNGKYDYSVLNLHKRDFYTVSKPDKKVIIKYNLDKLLEIYEKEDLKEGYKRNSELNL